MSNRNIILFVNHNTKTFALSTREDSQESRLPEVIEIHRQAGYDYVFLARDLTSAQSKAGLAVFRAAFESGCGYTYQTLITISRPLG